MKKVEIENNDIKAKSLGAIKKVEIENSVFYFRKPHRHALGLALAKLDINPVEANEILINNSIIAEVSDMEGLKDDSIFFALFSHVGDLMQVKKSLSTML